MFLCLIEPITEPINIKSELLLFNWGFKVTKPCEMVVRRKLMRRVKKNGKIRSYCIRYLILILLVALMLATSLQQWCGDIEDHRENAIRELFDA